MTNPDAARNMSLLKQQNRAAILRAIRRSGGLARSELSAMTGLSKGGLTPLVGELMALGLVSETVSLKTPSGRKPLRLELCAEGCSALAVDWTRTELRAALVDFCGRPVRTLRRELERGLDAPRVLRRIAGMLRALRGDAASGLLGVGVVAPGPLDMEAGRILNPPNFNGWHDVAIAQYLGQHTGLPIFVDNNANAHAQAESDHGHGKQYQSFAHVIVDEGVGGAIVVQNEILRGPSRRGSELGHITLHMGGKPCPCGNTGCVERYAAIPELLMSIPAEHRPASFSGFVARLQAGDPHCAAAMEREGAYLANLLISLANLFEPEALVLGSRITGAGGALVRSMEAHLSAHPAGRAAAVPILLSQLENPSLIGSASIVFDHFLSGDLGSYEQVLGKH